MSVTRLKPMPVFASDEEAERFVDEADLSEYDLSGFRPMPVLRKGYSDVVTFDLPPHLVHKLDAQASALNLSMSDVVRTILEDHFKDV